MRPLTILFSCFLLLPPVGAVELSSRERSIVAGVNAAVAKAGANYQVGNYEAAGEQILRAIKQAEVAAKNGSPALYDSLRPALDRISRAHTMLEFEGVSLPPFRVPSRPEAAEPMTEEAAANDPQPATTADPAGSDTILFTSQVAPILVNRCGRCHVSDSKGRFNMASFAALMKGPPEGVVVFPGDTVASRLIETIETGDMPRGGGRVPAEELQLLKAWIEAGAKFDGPDPEAPITAGAPPPAAPSTPRLAVQRATGNETVSFAADIAPLLVDNCNGCHLDAMQTRGGLRMDDFAGLLRGGDSGPVIVPGKAAESLLVKKLRGSVGERMPSGGRPALSSEAIELISTWIDEGAKLDGASENQPLRVMSQLAWAAAASPEELSERRAELADKNLRLAFPRATAEKITTEHFLVTGNASQQALQLVARQAEEQIKLAQSVVRSDEDEGEGYFRGRATIFVTPQRYDYSELAKMVEGRSVPPHWRSHWRFDGIDAYVALVAGDSEEEEVIGDRLASPIIALAVATRSFGVPRWLAEGVGTSIASRRSATRDREAKLRLDAELSQAFAALENAKQFLQGKMSPEHSDLIGAALATAMLDRSYRRGFDAMLRQLEEGTPFDVAFERGFGTPLEAFVTGWLKFARGG